jgi:hypothetical protein
MNVGIGTDAAQFQFWEYLFLIFGILSSQCILDIDHTPTMAYQPQSNGLVGRFHH